jgi:hypothetical protein
MLRACGLTPGLALSPWARMLNSTVEIMTNMVRGTLLVRIQVNILLGIGNSNAAGVKLF